MLRVVHFEIHASDPERAAKFYTDIFGWEFKEWKFGDNMPEENRYWMVMTEKGTEGGQAGKWPGINGGMVIRRGEVPEDFKPVGAFVCTIDVPNIDEYIEKIKAAGGREALGKMPIPSVGWLAYFKDTEGNTFGIMQEDPTAK